MTTTWPAIEAALIDRFGATPRCRKGTSRSWSVPSPTGGHLTVEVTLRPRWCSLAVDRWHTTDRDPRLSKPWMTEHVVPAVEAAAQVRGRYGRAVSSGRTFAAAYPIDRADVLAVLVPWVEQELAWTTDESP